MEPSKNGRQLPQNSEAEASLLGALLIDSDAIVKIADHLAAEDFFDIRHRRIYEAVIQLYEKRKLIDVLTLADQLKANDLLDSIGGPAYLAELTNFVPSASHAEEYADIIAQKAMRRRLITVSQELGGFGFDETKEFKDLIEEAEVRLFEVSGRHIKQTVVSLESILSDSFERLDELHRDKGKLRGVPTGFKDLDNVLAGLQRSDLFVLAARPSMGKTALMLNFAHNVATKAKQPVLIFSLEMSKEQLVDRLLAMESGVDAWALRNGNLTDADFEKLGQAMGTLGEAPIFIDDSPGITVSDLRTKSRREAHKQGLGLIIVDYLQLMSGGSRFGSEGNRVQEISEISRGLKSIARELNVPLMAASQLSRSVESRSPQIPQLADLRESGCLSGDTPVYLPNTGQSVPIRDLMHADGQIVSSIDTETHRLRPATITRAFCTGEKPVHRLTSKAGRSIRATGNHKFLTKGGWKRLDELSPEEYIATPRSLSDSHQANSTASASHSRQTIEAFPNDIYWDQINSITPDGLEEVFDLTIAETHNFVAGDIFVHNSIEQDADVVAFIYREDYYNPETDRRNLTDILIKKHRNGPTKDVELYFDKNRQRFRGVDTKHQDPFTS